MLRSQLERPVNRKWHPFLRDSATSFQARGINVSVMEGEEGKKFKRQFVLFGLVFREFYQEQC